MRNCKVYICQLRKLIIVRQINKRVYIVTLFTALIVVLAGFVGLLWGRSLLVPSLFVSYVDIGTYMPGQVIERVVRLEQVFFGMVVGDSIVNRIIRLEVIGPGWESIKIGQSGFQGISAKLQQKSEKRFELHCVS